MPSKIEQLENAIYNLILDVEITDKERHIFLKAKDDFSDKKDSSRIISDLKIELAPLGLRQQLSPKALEFYVNLQKEFPVRDKIGRPNGLFF
ncbi:bacteriocin immunity protein [Streptococcus sciuri]|uniref:Bacteriocin immunity protein n=1 Tax=Streptococcus sciuri TaxID=2973939 RepID=A0ABT2F7I7_9STRE|nr:bacteriocin immunity protein [Streptococcus sciuri]MCS4488418.1 bacteriocin immunity protein [Streptococcus sciuri]